MKEDSNKVDNLIKIIADLSCIKSLLNNENIGLNHYLEIFELIYIFYLENWTIDYSIIDFSVEDIEDFSYWCMENQEIDLMRLGENLQFAALDFFKE